MRRFWSGTGRRIEPPFLGRSALLSWPRCMTPLLHTPLFSSTELRAALGAYATGVTVVTCLDDSGRPLGLTVNSFSSVSLDPPLVLWSLNTRSVSRPAFEAADHFGVSVLATQQQHLAQRFASKMRRDWNGVVWRAGMTGVPLMENAAAWFECATVNRQREGDHLIFIGRVKHCERQGDAAPLLFFDGRYHTGHALRSRVRSTRTA